MSKDSFAGRLAVMSAGVAMLSLTSMVYGAGQEIVPGLVVVPDPILASMRGKYVASTTQVVYFGVQMQSNWATPDGTMLNAGANVSVNLSNSTPTVSFHPTVNYAPADNGNVLTDTTGRTVTSSGIDNVSGVTQSVQLAGDYNQVGNTASVNLLSDIPVDEPVPGDVNRASFDSNHGGVGMSGYSALDGNSAVVHLEVDGQGVAEQSIRGTILGATGKGAYQTIVVLGDHHRISNQMSMNVVLRNESESSVLQQGLGTAIGNLRGLTPHQ